MMGEMLFLIAEPAGMNPGLLRQYASGVKFPSVAQAQKVEDAIQELAKELGAVSLAVSS
jgi:hypothetical protein